MKGELERPLHCPRHQLGIIILRVVNGQPGEFSKPSPAINEISDLLHSRHEIGAAVPGNYYGTAGIAESGSFVPTPTAHMTIEKTGAKRITGPEDIVYLHRIAWSIDLLDSGIALIEVYPNPLGTPLFQDSLRAQREKCFYRLVRITCDPGI